MVQVLRIRMARLPIKRNKSRRKFLNKIRVDTDLRPDRSCNVIAMIHNVWNRALSSKFGKHLPWSWELNRDLNTMPLHVRHGVWNHGPLEWCHNERDDIWDHRRLDYLLSRLLRRRSKKTSTLRVTGICEGKSTIWWRLHATQTTKCSHESSDYQRKDPQGRLRIHGPLWGKYTGEQWILPTKGQQYGKRFDVMTPSWDGETRYFAWRM